jgi:RimJ/RimL family protein N-acetyltransferase
VSRAWADLAAVTKQNDHVELHVISEADREGLHAIAMDVEIWAYFVTAVHSDADFDAFFAASLADQEAGRRVVHVVVDRASGRIAGSMSYGNLAEADRRLEIGWSWLGRDFRGRGVNRWAKYLLLEHAFESLGAERVEFKTDELNEPARRGLVNIGASFEGVLRSYNPMPGGRRRNAAWYSILRPEWPDIKAQLAARPRVIQTTGVSR